MPEHHKTIVYTRTNCHLCDDALEILKQHGLSPELIDIDDDPQLQSAHTDWVPVVEIDGTIRFRGRVNPTLLRRILSNPNASDVRE